jgi:hypothetical protein
MGCTRQRTLTALFGLLVATGAFGTTGCFHPYHHRVVQPVVVQGHGPPPHAPAHGYRHKHRHHDVELAFDSGLGVYVVVGLPATYWHADRYWRWAAGSWQVSTRVGDGWAVAGHSAVPAKLMAKHAKHRGKARGHHPAAPAKHAH